MAYDGPTQDAFITQIEADLKSTEGESDAVLKERLRLVKAANTDAAASKAYFDHLNGPDPEPSVK